MNKGVIVAVDDSPDLLKLVNDILSAEGYEVHSAGNGEAALVYITHNPIDLVLLDIAMPDMSGLEVLSILKSNPETNTIPVILLSASSARTEGLKRGAADFIAIPFNQDDLLARIHTHIEMARLYKTLEHQSDVLKNANEQLTRELEHRKKIEESLRASEEKYRAVADNATDIVWTLDLKTQRFTYVSPSVMRLRGFTPEEAMALSLEETLSPVSYRALMEQLATLLDSKNTTAADFGSIRVIQGEQCCKDGSLVSFEATLKFLLDEQGRPVSVTGITRDITERKKIEAALRESEERHKTFINSTIDLVFLKDEHFRYLFSNNANAAFLGKTPEEIIGRDDFELMPPAMATQCRAGDTAALTGNRMVVSEEKAGHRVFETRKFPVPLRNGRAGVGGYIRDITEQKTAAERILLSRNVLDRMSHASDPVQAIHDVLLIIKNSLGVDAAAIRLSENGDFPYYDACGFSDDFIQRESPLCGTENDNRPFLPCLCGAVIEGRTDPAQPYFTAAGSFWTNSTTDLLAALPENNRPLQMRHRCNQDGYESMALIPLRADTEIIGLLQLNDRRRDQFTPDAIQFFEDITASIALSLSRIKADQTLRASEERWRGLFENAMNGVALHQIVIDRQGAPVDYIFLEANPSFEKHTGLRIADIVGKRVTAVLPGIEQTGLIATYGNVVITGTPVSFQTYTEPLKRHFGISAYKVDNDKFVTVFDDITEQKLAETTLRESEEKFRSIADNFSDVIYLMDIKGNFTYLSPSTTTIFGYTPDEVRGRFFGEFLGEGDLEKAVAAFEKGMRTGNATRNLVLRARRKDGSTIILELNATVLRKDGEITGTLGVIRDITERKRLEEELIKAHKLDSLGLLAGGIAHDFNNILTGIIVNISMVRRALDAAGKETELLTETEKAAFEAKNLTQQLLTFSKGGAPVKKPSVLTDVLLESAVFATRGSKTKCAFSIAPDMRLVEIDPGQITQVVSNIVINAVQAMPDGGEIAVTADNIELTEQSPLPLKPGPYVRVAIADTGTGIPANLLDKIFDPFFTTRKTGNGLGLATSFSIIRNHNGHITVQSEPGKGTTFTLYLPAFTGQAKQTPARRVGDIHKGSGRILVMDDEHSICVVVTRLLAELGYTAECTGDSDQAVARYRETMGTKDAFNAVILDLTVRGGKGGKEAIAELTKINPAVKAIVSSGYSSDPIIANYKDFGFAAALSKPYSIEMVSEVLFHMLNAEK